MKYRNFNLKQLERLSGELAEAESYLSDMVDATQGYYDERSDKWMESERGEAYQERMDELDSIREAVESLNYDLQTLLDNLNEE